MLEEMKLKDIMQLLDSLKVNNKDDMWKIGENYFIRTVTMHLTGKLIAITDKELLLQNASWIADSGRFHDALKNGEFEEVEPFVNDVIVNRNSIIDATIWGHDLPLKQK